MIHQSPITGHRRIRHGRTRPQTFFPFFFPFHPLNLRRCRYSSSSSSLSLTITVVNGLYPIHRTPVHHRPRSVSGTVCSVRTDGGQNDVVEEVIGVGRIIIIFTPQPSRSLLQIS